MTSTLRAPVIPATRPRPRRLLSLDVLRGVAVAGMLIVNNPGVRAATPAALKHSGWSGMSVADAIFPMFLFAIGMSMPLSRRAAAPRLAIRRVVVLIGLGIALVWVKYGNPSPAGVLQHIAGAYLVAWLVLRLPRKLQPVAAAGILAAAWAAFTFLAPGSVHRGSWGPGDNLAEFLDGRLFGVSFSGEGFTAMLMSAPSILGGVFVARSVLGRPVTTVVRRLLAWSVAGLAGGLLLAWPIPVVKHLWTPSYAVLGFGVSCAVLALLHWIVHRRGHRAWTRPFTDLGSNPIAIYVGISVLAALVLLPMQATVVQPISTVFGDTAASVLYALAVTVIGWAAAVALRRRDIYLRV
jgi:predicted acyltransferase